MLLGYRLGYFLGVILVGELEAIHWDGFYRKLGYRNITVEDLGDYLCVKV